MTTFFNFLTATLILGLCSTAFAVGEESKKPSEVKFKTDRAVVFKDGYCLIVKNGTAKTDDNGVVFTHNVPDSAVLGSFWAIPDSGKIESMVAGWVEEEIKDDREVSCTNVFEVIKANIGNNCTFKLGDNETVSGKILKVLEKAVTETPDDPFAAATSTRSPLSSFSPVTVTTRSNVTGTHFVVRTDSGDMVIAATSVSALTIKNLKSTLKENVRKKTKQKQIAFDFGKPNQEVNFRLIYFRPDLRWIPTYRIELTDNLFVEKQEPRKPGRKVGDGQIQKKIAELYLQGEILNEAEDLIDVPIHVVVGVPNFRFRETPSPMTLEANMRSALANAAPQVMGRGQQLSNAMFNQRRSDYQSDQASGQNDLANVDFSQQSGRGTNDLFVYELKKMSLKKGDRAMVSILNTKVAYRDVYTWDVKIKHNQWNVPTNSQTDSPLELSKNRVWRQIELFNSTEFPWTTGAAMMMNGFLPLGQELLTYTSPGDVCRIPVTVAIDLKGTFKDVETGRDLNALKWNGRDYTKMSGKISIEVENNKNEPVPVEITVRFGGKAKTTSSDGEITLESFQSTDWEENNYRNALNNSSLIKWKSTIAPSDCFKPTVDYEYFFHF